ncbi:hypothetical protein ACXNSR_32790 [Streptomyces sp. NC-S4]
MRPADAVPHHPALPHRRHGLPLPHPHLLSGAGLDAAGAAVCAACLLLLLLLAARTHPYTWHKEEPCTSAT